MTAAEGTGPKRVPSRYPARTACPSAARRGSARPTSSPIGVRLGRGAEHSAQDRRRHGGRVHRRDGPRAIGQPRRSVQTALDRHLRPSTWTGTSVLVLGDSESSRRGPAQLGAAAWRGVSDKLSMRAARPKDMRLQAAARADPTDPIGAVPAPARLPARGPVAPIRVLPLNTAHHRSAMSAPAGTIRPN
jgi:hypothetical protein